MGKYNLDSIYGVIPEEPVSSNLDDLISQVFKLLPYKENENSLLENHFSSLLYRLTGLSELFPDFPELITVISVLEAARTQDNDRLYRKAVLDSCAILKKLQAKLDE